MLNHYCFFLGGSNFGIRQENKRIQKDKILDEEEDEEKEEEDEYANYSKDET
jgi:hypothetical protein